jgi:lipoteichoic acid synthase
VSETEKPFAPNNEEFNRYLNAVHYSDAVLGKLLDELKERNLAESTLVVVVGDHGEAFGRHGQYGHRSSIYEENVRIPLIFINPLLFCGQDKQVIAGLVDLPVTIMDILNHPIPEDWQGESLFDKSRTSKTYFFSTWSEYLYGYRYDKYKVIFNLYKNQTQVFDIEADPEEKVNIASSMPELVKDSQTQLAYWMQYNEALLTEAKLKSSEQTLSIK